MSLLNFLGSDDAALGLGLLAAGRPSTDPNMGFGARLAGAVGNVQANRQGAMKAKLLQSQIDENASQAALRQAQAQQEARKLAMQQQWLTRLGGGAGGAPGAGGGVAGMTPEDIMALRMSGGPDITPLWQATRPDMVEVAPGMWADKRAMAPGVNQAALAARTADRIEQSDINMRGDMVPFEDAAGREWKVPKASLVAPAVTTPQRAPVVLPGGPLGAPRTGPGYAGGSSTAAADGTRDILTSELSKAQQQLATAAQRGDVAGAQRAQADITGLQREMGRLPGGAPAVRTPAPMIGPGAGMPAGSIPSGMSRAEEDAADLAKLKTTEQVKADTAPTAGKVQKYTSAHDAVALIDKALAHPGLPKATGMQGWLDPRNVIPGTQGTDFKVLRDQLKGTAFLSAYNELKGGGAITEAEGRKAEEAIARLNTAQSTPSFKEALNDYKAILKRGMDRAAGTLPAGSVDDLKPTKPAAAVLPSGWSVKVK